MTRRTVARATSIRLRRLGEIERGKVMPSEPELATLAEVFDTNVAELVPIAYRLSLVTDEGELHGDTALDALLREYLSMVRELRSVDTVPTSTLRRDDLTELGRALGGTPDAIEARLVELLETDSRTAHELRDTILPSSMDASARD